MTKEWDSETSYKSGDEFLLNGRRVRVIAVGPGGGITDLENVEPNIAAVGAIEALTMRVERLEKSMDNLLKNLEFTGLKKMGETCGAEPVEAKSIKYFDTHLGPVKVVP